MAQVFHPSMNVLSRVSLAALVLLIASLAWGFYEVNNSPYYTDQGVIQPQPVPFSHEHHVKGLGIDCRYCHTSVTESSFAGIPATKVCMTCHSQIWTGAPILEPVRESWRSGQPIVWSRVHNLPNYVYFNHSIHVAKGVGCASCHGPVQDMPLMAQNATLQMRWCLDCHRAPEQYLRPREEVFNMNYQPPPNQLEVGRQLKERYHVLPVRQMETCSTCHR